MFPPPAPPGAEKKVRIVTSVVDINAAPAAVRPMIVERHVRRERARKDSGSAFQRNPKKKKKKKKKPLI